MIDYQYIIIGFILLLTAICFVWWKSGDTDTDTKAVAFDEKDTIIPEVGKELNDQEFISSPSFTGRKPGYVFKRGDQGQGYYRDELEMLKLKI